MSIEQQIFRDAPTQSADWRFILPFSAKSKILFLGERSEYLQEFFKNIGFASTAWQSEMSVAEDSLLHLKASAFDIIAIPYGIVLDSPLGRSGMLNAYKILHNFLEPEGVLFLGLSNILLRRDPKILSASFPQTQLILRRAGYASSEFHAAYPNLAIPEYIFPLKTSTLRFFFRFHFKNKIPKLILRALSNPVALGGLSNLIPFYFVVAKA